MSLREIQNILSAKQIGYTSNSNIFTFKLQKMNENKLMCNSVFSNKFEIKGTCSKIEAQIIRTGGPNWGPAAQGLHPFVMCPNQL